MMSSLPDEFIQRLYQQVWDQDEIDPNHTQWSVESVTQVGQRLEKCLGQVSLSLPRESVLFITHGDPTSILLRGLRGIGVPSHHRIYAPQTGQLIKVIE